MAIFNAQGAALPIRIDDLTQRIERLLGELGAGLDSSSVAYDTAWVARLHAKYPHYGFDGALEWMRRNQHADGSWGGAIVHYHDRVISTLSCLTALKALGDPADTDRIRRAEAALFRLCGRLRCDAQDTIGFPLLSVALTQEAQRLGCEVPPEFGQASDLMRKKLAEVAGNPKALRRSTVVFSMEALGNLNIEETDFLEGTGMVAASPSATSALLLMRSDESALSCLHALIADQPDHGAADLCPIDLFEIAWALNHLRMAKTIEPSHPSARRALEHLWRSWSPKNGMSPSSRFKITDADDTAAGFTALEWGGLPVNPEVFAYYERSDWFCTFSHEADPSTSANIHVLMALRGSAGHKQTDAWMNQCLTMLARHKGSGAMWSDKWHISPYYATCDAIFAIQGLNDELIQPSIDWIKNTQREDGGWGFYDRSTAEETAYAMEALLLWQRAKGGVDPERLANGARYLCAHIDDSDPPALWIGKGLYAPVRVVRAAVLSALYSYLTQ